MTTFQCKSHQAFLDAYDDIAQRVGNTGYALIDAWDCESATLKQVAERFGAIQRHIRSDANGLCGVATDTLANREWENYRSEYTGVSSGEFLPHTDGSFLHGLVHRDDGHYLELLPPRLLILQCTQTADSGGANILVDGQHLYDTLVWENRMQLEILSTRGCVTYCRDDQIALDRAVFEELDDGGVMLRFRYDSTAYVADWALKAFHDLQNDYMMNPRWRTRLMLKAGQILIIDNSRMLHGRDAFTDGGAGNGRKLRRVWVAHDQLPVFHNAANEHRERRALMPFQAYDTLSRSTLPSSLAPERLGIRKPFRTLSALRVSS
jgi:alpha-ketoglutarate-dependent taurine dioxygenase